MNQNNRSGMGLMGMLVVVVITGIVLAATASSLTNFGRAIKSNNQSIEIGGDLQIVKMTLSKTDICAASLLNSSGSAVKYSTALTSASPDAPDLEINAIKTPGGVSLLKVDELTGSITVKKMTFKQVVAGDPTGASPYVMKLSIQFSKTQTGQAAAVGGSILSREIPIVAKIVGDTIVSCSSDQLATPITVSSLLTQSSCVVRNAEFATQVSCGLKSQVSCLAGEYAVSGGLYASGNGALQNSSPIVDADNKPIGWQITMYDINGSGACTNSFDGSTRLVSTGFGTLHGGATVLCCH